MDDLIDREAAIDAYGDWYVEEGTAEGFIGTVKQLLEGLPSAQPKIAKRIVGKSRGGITLWYQCDMCNEPVDAQDNFCRRCGRRLIDG